MGGLSFCADYIAVRLIANGTSRHFAATQQFGRFWRIVLKKSDFTSDQNFAEAPAHSSENDVGDRVTDPISTGKPPQALCKALNYQSLVSTGVPRNFAVISFLSFSTLSALSGLMHRSKHHPYSITLSGRAGVNN